MIRSRPTSSEDNCVKWYFRVLMRFVAVNQSNSPSIYAVRLLVGSAIVALCCVFLKMTAWGLLVAGSADRLWTILSYHILGIVGVPVLRYETTLLGPKGVHV